MRKEIRAPLRCLFRISPDLQWTQNERKRNLCCYMLLRFECRWLLRYNRPDCANSHSLVPPAWTSFLDYRWTLATPTGRLHFEIPHAPAFTSLPQVLFTGCVVHLNERHHIHPPFQARNFTPSWAPPSSLPPSVAIPTPSPASL